MPSGSQLTHYPLPGSTEGGYDKAADFVKTCYLNADDFPECSRDSVQGVFNGIKDGYEPLDIPPLDPLFIPELRILQGGDGPVSVNASLANVTITGMGRGVVMSNSVDHDTFWFVTRIAVPLVRIQGYYILMGRALLLPITGSGDAWFEPRDMEMNATTQVSVKEREGVKFFKVDKVKVDFEVKGLKFRMNNLYNGLKTLEESTNIYLNENWRPVLESIKPVLAKTIEDVLFSLLERVFYNTPAKFFIADVEEIPA
ncbi:protein takeout [Anabrus simplex]|uniref:protein takeout n=1 Tax=Anabrus simplex TaxID=316456 RepID=UPI0035A33059